MYMVVCQFGSGKVGNVIVGNIVESNKRRQGCRNWSLGKKQLKDMSMKSVNGNAEKMCLLNEAFGIEFIYMVYV